MAPDTELRADERADLRADCGRCVGLCCVAPGFVVSADFALDKPAGQPCVHLRADDRCAIHTDLRTRGFPGCATYDCFGAGQRVTAAFGRHSWRDDAATAAAMFEAYGVMRQLHELLWLVDQALRLEPEPAFARELHSVGAQVSQLTERDLETLRSTDPGPVRAGVGELLREVSRRIRQEARPDPPDRRGLDLTGADLRAADLRAADLRSCSLLGADLRGVDLTRADLLGADLRAADLRGSDLAGALFLTQAQVDSARGDRATILPTSVRRPLHWLT